MDKAQQQLVSIVIDLMAAISDLRFALEYINMKVGNKLAERTLNSAAERIVRATDKVEKLLEETTTDG